MRAGQRAMRLCGVRQKRCGCDGTKVTGLACFVTYKPQMLLSVVPRHQVAHRRVNADRGHSSCCSCRLTRISSFRGRRGRQAPYLKRLLFRSGSASSRYYG